ncbi:Integrator complex subunit 2 [Geranomyces variabilis]|nr:Integrator complex subunit 2 [Geranomyces variabilis]
MLSLEDAELEGSSSLGMIGESSVLNVPYLVSLYADLDMAARTLAERLPQEQVSLVIDYFRLDFADIWRTLHSRGLLPSPAPSDFLNSPPQERIRFVLSELSKLQHEEEDNSTESATAMNVDRNPFRSPIFEDASTRAEVARILFIGWHKDKGLISLPRLVRTLLQLSPDASFASDCVIVFATSCPPLFMKIVHAMLDVVQTGTPTSRIMSIVGNTITTMCKGAPNHAFSVRALLTERQLLPQVSLQLSLDYCKDELTYLNSTFTHSHRPYLPRNHPELAPLLIRVQRSAFASLVGGPEPLPESEVCIILRMLCGMTGMLGVTYPEAVLQLCLQLSQSGSSDRRSQLYLCFLILCADQCVRYFVDAFTQKLSQVFNSGHSDLSLMILVFVHTGQLLEVESVVRKTLNMPVQIPRESLHQLKTILTQKLFSTKEMARRALAPRPVVQSKTETESFAMIVVYHLLRENIFETNGIDVRDWMWRQIKTACLPVHPLMPGILEMYVQSLSKRGAISRISDRDIASVFSDMSSVTPSHVLGCHYVLLYRAMMVELPRLEIHQAAIGGPISFQAPSLDDYDLPSLPTKRILYHAETDGDHQAYRLLYPKFAGLVAEQEPQILDFAGLVGQEEEEPLRLKQFALDMSIGLKYKELFPKERITEHRDNKEWLRAALTPEKFSSIWNTAAADTLSAIKAVQILQALPPAALAPFLSPVIESLLPVLIVAPETETIAALESHFQKLWTKFYTYFPQKTCLETTRILTRRPVQTTGAPKLISAFAAAAQKDNGNDDDDSDLVSDPLLVFGCDSRVWKSRLGVKIALQALGFYMTASRHRYTAAFRATPAGQKAGLTDAHVDTLLQAQDAAVIQMLLETCVPASTPARKANDKNNKDGHACAHEAEEEEEKRRRVQRPIMLFVHQLFMDPAYIRLVHFQMYDARLIPLMVEMVPSMHFCFSFIPELIGAPSIERQVFGLQLMAHLAEKYPIEQSLKIAATVALPRVQTICANQAEYARVVKVYFEAEKMLALQKKGRNPQPQQQQQQSQLQPPAPPPRNVVVLQVVPLLFYYAHAFPSLAAAVSDIFEELKLTAPVSMLPGAPLPKSTADFVQRLQESIALTFGRIVKDVIMAPPAKLNKSII